MTSKLFNYDLMGKQVVVTQILNINYLNNNRTWVASNVVERRIGWVVGFRMLNNGNYDAGRSSVMSYYEEGGYEPPSLRVTSKTPCMLVTYWPTMNPVKVPLDGWMFPEDEPFANCPYSNAGYGAGSTRDKMRAHISAWCISESCPRDERGRFKKLNED